MKKFIEFLVSFFFTSGSVLASYWLMVQASHSTDKPMMLWWAAASLLMLWVAASCAMPRKPLLREPLTGDTDEL